MAQLWRNDNVFITSKRRRWRRLDVMKTLSLRRVPAGELWDFRRCYPQHNVEEAAGCIIIWGVMTFMKYNRQRVWPNKCDMCFFLCILVATGWIRPARRSTSHKSWQILAFVTRFILKILVVPMCSIRVCNHSMLHYYYSVHQFTGLAVLWRVRCCLEEHMISFCK